MIKLVITDLDRTLLRSDKSISAYTQDVFRRSREYGLKTAIATARSEAASKKYIDQIQPDIVISNGGGLVKIGSRVIYKSMLPAHISDGLIQACLENSSVGEITVETADAYYWNSLEIAKWPDFSHAVYHDFSAPLNCETYKITVEFSDKSLAPAMAEKFADCNVLEFSGENWVRFAHKHATKERAVEELMKKLNLSSDEVAAFGDDYNDLEMLRQCGHSVAVANAIEEVLKAAKYLTESNDQDGVAKYIETNFLSR